MCKTYCYFSRVFIADNQRFEVSDRELGGPRAVDDCTAVVDAWFPGQQGGVGFADVVFGAVSAGGRSPQVGSSGGVIWRSLRGSHLGGSNTKIRKAGQDYNVTRCKR